MSFVTWLPEVLEDAGLDVYVMPGAETRSTWRSGFDLNAIIWHHTATGLNWQDGHVAALLRDGRVDLSGPLSQVGIERDGTWVIVAMGRANHNGARTARFGNDSLGLEFYNRGDGKDPWPDVQVESGVIGTAAILNHVGDRPVFGHKESDPTRKVDPTLYMPAIRDRITVARKTLITPAPRPTTTEDDEMATTELVELESSSGKRHTYRVLKIGGEVVSLTWYKYPEDIKTALYLGVRYIGGSKSPVHWPESLWRSLNVVNGPCQTTTITS